MGAAIGRLVYNTITESLQAAQRSGKRGLSSYDVSAESMGFLAVLDGDGRSLDYCCGIPAGSLHWRSTLDTPSGHWHGKGHLCTGASDKVAGERESVSPKGRRFISRFDCRRFICSDLGIALCAGSYSSCRSGCGRSGADCNDHSFQRFEGCGHGSLPPSQSTGLACGATFTGDDCRT